MVFADVGAMFGIWAEQGGDDRAGEGKSERCEFVTVDPKDWWV